jgi:hypothetical protein
MARSRPRYRVGFGTRLMAPSLPTLQQPDLSQEEIPTRRIPRVTMPTQQSSQEMPDRGSAVIETKIVDGEEADPARTNEIAWPMPPWAADTVMVEEEKRDPARTSEVAWLMPPWAADTEVVDEEKIDPAAAEVEKGETAHAGSDDDDTVEMPPVAAVVPLSAVLVSGPSHGSLTLNHDGSLTYSPDDNFNGSDSFTCRASDGSLAPDSATLTLTVTARHHPQTVTVGAVDGRSGTAILTVTVTDGQACDSVQVTVKVGASGKDTLTGPGADELLAPSGNNDAQSGADGKDLLRAASGSDTLSGGPADDSLDDDSGADQLPGGSGADASAAAAPTATDFIARQG